MSDNKSMVKGGAKSATFRVKVEGPGINFTHEIDSEKIPAIMAVCYGARSGGPSEVPSMTQKNTQTRPGQEESLREYVNRLNPQYEAQRILTFAGYIKSYRGQGLFDRNAIKSLYREAQEVVPANLGRDIANAIRKGWIADDREKPGSFYVTNTGEKLLGSGELPRITRKRAKRSKSKASDSKNA